MLARTALSQMDVPTRQALVMSVVEPSERTAAAAVTNAEQLDAGDEARGLAGEDDAR